MERAKIFLKSILKKDFLFIRLFLQSSLYLSGKRIIAYRLKKMYNEISK